MTFNEKYSVANRQRFFDELEAERLAQTLFTFWPKGIAMRWFYLAFQALEKSGLTYFETEAEEMAVRLRIIWLSVFYYEFCYQTAFHESVMFRNWQPEMIHEIKKDLAKSETEAKNVYDALNKYWKNELNIFAELWINCEEGAQNILKKLEDSTYLYHGIVGDHIRLHFNMEQGFKWVMRQECSLDYYKSMSI